MPRTFASPASSRLQPHSDNTNARNAGPARRCRELMPGSPSRCQPNLDPKRPQRENRHSFPSSPFSTYPDPPTAALSSSEGCHSRHFLVSIRRHSLAPFPANSIPPPPANPAGGSTFSHRSPRTAPPAAARVYQRPQTPTNERPVAQRDPEPTATPFYTQPGLSWTRYHRHLNRLACWICDPASLTAPATSCPPRARLAPPRP